MKPAAVDPNINMFTVQSVACGITYVLVRVSTSVYDNTYLFEFPEGLRRLELVRDYLVVNAHCRRPRRSQ